MDNSPRYRGVRGVVNSVGLKVGQCSQSKTEYSVLSKQHVRQSNCEPHTPHEADRLQAGCQVSQRRSLTVRTNRTTYATQPATNEEVAFNFINRACKISAVPQEKEKCQYFQPVFSHSLQLGHQCGTCTVVPILALNHRLSGRTVTASHGADISSSSRGGTLASWSHGTCFSLLPCIS